MYSPRTAATATDTRVDTSIDSGIGDRSRASCGVGLGYALTAEPLGLVHHCARVRQAADVPNLHQQAASCLEDVDCLIVANGDEALTVHLQNLVAHLQQVSSIEDKSYILVLPMKTNCTQTETLG